MLASKIEGVVEWKKKSQFFNYPSKDCFRQESSINAKSRGEVQWGSGYLHDHKVSPPPDSLLAASGKISTI